MKNVTVVAKFDQFVPWSHMSMISYILYPSNIFVYWSYFFVH